MKKMKTVPRMQQAGHYTRPAFGTSQMNMPKRGRVGKIMPPMKKLGKK